ncbi:OST3/OST6 family protein [Aspergillus melleus]|uniref:OST3/OST6 family protein n=1 Tax=Aspergillus melleus TaxID=138277 RepID=UPI001E8DB06A|nr:oligosaccharyl transferase subunit ost3/OST6 [Aspergillus melleus]KAH8434735.1 oligosaccharyl transferase subunit ost3/OST6 [Aspergillus melleus]
MKLFTPIVTFLWMVTCAFAATPSPSKFEKYLSLSRSGPLDLDDSLYEDLTSKPRDYHVAVILTATDARYGCILCRDFQPEWELIARSWSKGSKSDELKLLFATLDFSQGKATFQKLMLQTAPVVLVFPPTVGPFAKVDDTPFRFDFSGPISADQLYTWINRHLPEGSKPPLVRPINYMRLITVVTLLMGALTMFTVLSPYVLPIIQNRNLWAACSLIAILLFTSGHMFNHIRKVPYVVGDGKGGISYFAGGFSNQFGMETQIVAAIYAVLSFATIAIAMKVPRIADNKAQQVAVVIWGTVLLGMYSFLLSVFKAKNGGYPFFLPPF